MKKYSKLIALSLLIIMLLCTASCGKSDIEDESSQAPADISSAESIPPLLFPETSDTAVVSDDPAEPVMVRSFVYEKPGFGEEFRIYLHSDGTYNYYEGFLSSYMGDGTWALEDGILAMTERDYGDGSPVYRFRYSDDALTYIAEGSDQFSYIKVADGEKFEFDKEYEKTSSVLAEIRTRMKIFKFKDAEKYPGFGLFIFENKSFSTSCAYAVNPASSIGPTIYGSWSEEDGIITLSAFSTDFQGSTCRFRYDGSSLVYIDSDADFFNECTLKKGDVLVEE